MLNVHNQLLWGDHSLVISILTLILTLSLHKHDNAITLSSICIFLSGIWFKKSSTLWHSYSGKYDARGYVDLVMQPHP